MTITLELCKLLPQDIFFKPSPPLKEDPGDFGLSAKTFLSVFRHKIILNKVMRQDKNDFVKAINDISYS